MHVILAFHATAARLTAALTQLQAVPGVMVEVVVDPAGQPEPQVVVRRHGSDVPLCRIAPPQHDLGGARTLAVVLGPTVSVADLLLLAGTAPFRPISVWVMAVGDEAEVLRHYSRWATQTDHHLTQGVCLSVQSAAAEPRHDWDATVSQPARFSLMAHAVAPAQTCTSAQIEQIVRQCLADLTAGQDTDAMLSRLDGRGGPSSTPERGW